MAAGGQVFDDVWQQFARLSSPGQYSRDYLDGDFQGPAEEFSSPTAQDTTVLVAGATGRVGRILVRKLLLRGYKVCILPWLPTFSLSLLLNKASFARRA